MRVNTALNNISSSNAFTNSRYLGSDLYAWRIDAYSDINAGKSYYNVYAELSLYESSTQLYPPQITNTVWESFISWQAKYY